MKGEKEIIYIIEKFEGKTENDREKRKMIQF